MGKISLGAFIAVVLFVAIQYLGDKKKERDQLDTSSVLIEKTLENVGKLIVAEASYAQVFSYEDSKEFYFDVFSARKKALVIVNAEASISYDLHKVEKKVDTETKTVYITFIPEPELKIHPSIEYYDVTQDYLNQFEAADYNIIKQRVEKALKEIIEASSLKTNAENRLIAELQKLYILTNTLGWKLQYNNQLFNESVDFKSIKL